MQNHKTKSKMKSVKISRHVSVDASAIWNIVRTGNGVEKWFPIIASCDLKGTGPGAKRVCVTQDGQTLEETIVSIDEQNREFVLRIDKQSIMPITDIINRLSVSDANGGAQVDWIAEFELADETMSGAIEQGLSDLYVMGIKGLEAATRSNM